MKTSIEFVLISPFFIGLSIITQAQPTSLFHFCQSTTIFTRSSAYQANLDLIFSSLSSNATRSIGFYNTSAGRDPDNVHGLFLCRGHVTVDACQNCVTAATQDILQLCPVEKEAIVWYDNCLLRFSNRWFFSTMSDSPAAYMWNSQNITDQSRFNSLLLTSMRQAATEAATTPSGGKKFAAKEAYFTEFWTLYNLVQCTPDISSSDCGRRLEIAISQLPIFCKGKIGGRVLTPSCNIRYELYPFYSPTDAGVPTGRSGSSTTVIAVMASITVTAMLFCVGCIFLRRRARRKYETIKEDTDGNEITTESLQIDLNTIEMATKKFSDNNKLGEGGFGVVYRGTLPNGQDIAVKKLSKSSAQGVQEFKNEVLLLAKLQHRNLVRLLGFCLEGEENILVYEFVPNKGLDCFLFDQEKRGQLDWSKRYKIIRGIARGILYLHEDSQLRIIHRDLKASNILLDREMNPKISDFGMAKIFEVDQTRGNKSRIVGTYGYMFPEYAMHGQFSIKSDMYSFGVLVLEIICGKKNSSFCQTNSSDNLVSYVWKHWGARTPMEVVDSILADSYSKNEMLRCIQIGLLCVQEDPSRRPAMADVDLMLNSYSVSLPVPQQKAFLFNSKSVSQSIDEGCHIPLLRSKYDDQPSP